eukprot:114947_1
MSSPHVSKHLISLPVEQIQLSLKLFESDDIDLSSQSDLPAIVLVHPWTKMGGEGALMCGLASELSLKGYPTIAFDLRGAGSSSGVCTWTGQCEVRDVVAVCEWARTNVRDHLVVVGSSAGAPIAGSAFKQLDFVVGYVGIGYPLGNLASVVFGSHYDAITSTDKPKLFIMGTADGFTSVSQFEDIFNKCQSPKFKHLVEGVGHFALEFPEYDAFMARTIHRFVQKNLIVVRQDVSIPTDISNDSSAVNDQAENKAELS